MSPSPTITNPFFNKSVNLINCRAELVFPAPHSLLFGGGGEESRLMNGERGWGWGDGVGGGVWDLGGGEERGR